MYKGFTDHVQTLTDIHTVSFECCSRREPNLTILHGCVADDFTGAVDLAGNFAARGLNAVVITEPDAALHELPADTEAVIIALKTRTASPDTAVRQSVDAFRRLTEAGARQLYFKYCSTFDSTEHGNIGPVIDAMLAELDLTTTIVVPSFPGNGRTVRDGRLSVWGELLEHSSMRHHPLTPMTESDVRLLLSRQAQTPVGFIDLATVRDSVEALSAALEGASTPSAVVIDAVTDADLATIATATAGLRFVTGGSGLALGVPVPERRAAEAPRLAALAGHRVILCGSASKRTQEQVQAAKKAGFLSLQVDPLADTEQTASIVRWARESWAERPDVPVLVYATGSPDDLATDDASAHSDAADRIERTLAEAAIALIDAGAVEVISAGGETSGRIVTELGISSLKLGQPICPGVSWARATTADDHVINLALKSGNFGSTEFFVEAWDELA
ncbi:Hrp-dependent type III effector protein [Pseudoclavibacter sp. RFBG4]|nr:Hrp-dependent type III effector protein [Pseudoclavibacter sp. RFBG4]